MPNEQEQQSSQTVTSEYGVSSEEGQGNAGSGTSSDNSDVIKRLSEAAGREFVSLDDAIKWADNTKRMVGDQSIAESKKLAEAYTGVLERVKPLAEKAGVKPETFLDYNLKQATEDLGDDYNSVKEYETSQKQSEEMNTLRRQLSELQLATAKVELLRDVPQANEYYDDFVKWAKGAGVEVSAESFKSSPFNMLAEAAKKAQNTSVIESSAQIGVTTTEYERAVKEFQKNPTDDNANAMVLAKLKQMEQ